MGGLWAKSAGPCAAGGDRLAGGAAGVALAAHPGEHVEPMVGIGAAMVAVCGRPPASGGCARWAAVAGAGRVAGEDRPADRRPVWWER